MVARDDDTALTRFDLAYQVLEDSLLQHENALGRSSGSPSRKRDTAVSHKVRSPPPYAAQSLVPLEPLFRCLKMRIMVWSCPS